MFVLAQHWHFHTPRQMLETLTRSEFLDAMSFYLLDPPGDRRADMRAMAAAMLASGNSSTAPNMIYPYYGNTFDEELQAEAFIDQLEAMQTTTFGPSFDPKPTAQAAPGLDVPNV